MKNSLNFGAKSTATGLVTLLSKICLSKLAAD